MKFARYLEDTQIPEWKRAYIDYRLLKKKIARIQRGQYDPHRYQDDGISLSTDPEPVTPSQDFPQAFDGRTSTIPALRFTSTSVDGVRRKTDSKTALKKRQLSSTTPWRTRSLRGLGNRLDSSRRRFSIPDLKSPKFTLAEIIPQLMAPELAFFNLLDSELDKIKNFYFAREVELQARTEELRKQLAQLGDHKKFVQAAHSSLRPWSSELINNMKGKFMHIGWPKIPTRINTVGDIELSPQHPGGDRLVVDHQDSEQGAGGEHTFSTDPDDYLHAKKKLKKAVLEHYRVLELLHNYRVLNVTGFRKALKKFEKITKIPAQEPYMTERVDKSVIASDKGIRVMMDDMESLYIIYFTRNDRKRARRNLKADSLIKSHHYSMFRSGLYIGFAIPPLVSGIWSSYQQSTRDRIIEWEALLQVYSILVVPVLFSVAVGINLLVWTRGRINYGFIFALDTRTRLDYREYFEIPSLLLVWLACAFWLSFSTVSSKIISPTAWPLVWLGFCLAVIVNPAKVFYRSSRYWLLRSIGRLPLSGMRAVEFTDFWLGDQLCSLQFTLSNIYFLGCVYHVGLDSPRWKQCGVRGAQWPLAFTFGSLPLIIRLVQSIKRYFDSGLRTHLVNGGKYASGVICNLFLYLWKHQGSAGRGTAFVLWCLFNCIYSVYGSAWDFWMDWSVLRVEASYFLLRKELVYTESIPLYYFAMVTNLVIRFIWIIYIPRRGPSPTVRAFTVALLEAYRRWQWNFYRLENEHLGNMDQYRVTREVPLPYTFAREESDDDADDIKLRESKPRDDGDVDSDE